MGFAVLLERNLSERFGPGVTKVQGCQESLDAFFPVLTHTSMEHAGARFRSEIEERLRSVNKTPQIN
jgi:hypothetical protein